MKDFILSCCSTADLSKEHLQSNDINYLCFKFSLDGVTYNDDLGQSMPFDKFYAAMDKGADTKTWQINADEYAAYFTPFLQNGQDILHICFSSGLSGSYNSARLACEELKQKFPDRKLYIVDSLAASSGYGLLMDKLSQHKKSGWDIDSIYNWAINNALKMHHLFFSTDLSYYVKGGRISKAAGIIGTILNICPLLNMDKTGKLTLKSKAMGKKKAMKKIMQSMEELADGGLCYSDKCFISQSNCLDDALVFKSLLKDRFPRILGEIQIFDIGTTIGSHTGSGTIALFFWGKERKE